jgi:hypothetical protein
MEETRMKLIPRDGIPTKYWYIRVYLDENPWIDFEVIRGLNIYLDRSLSTPNSFESNQDKDKRDYLSYGFPSQALRRSFLRHLQHVKGPAKVRIRYWVDSHSKIGGYFIPGDPCRFFPNIRLFSYFRGRTKELDTERNFRTVPRWLVVFSKAPFWSLPNGIAEDAEDILRRLGYFSYRCYQDEDGTSLYFAFSSLAIRDDFLRHVEAYQTYYHHCFSYRALPNPVILEKYMKSKSANSDSDISFNDKFLPLVQKSI